MKRPALLGGFVVVLGLILIVLYVTKHSEPFLDPSSDMVRPEIMKDYKTFVAFYQPFLVNWEKAVATSYGLNQPNVQSVSSPSRDTLNAYIIKLSQEKNIAFPPLTEPLPETIAQPTLPLLLTLVPADPLPYVNALTWMNTQLKTAQESLSSMMKGPVEGFIWARMKGLPQSPVVHQEGFETTCDQIAKCMDARDQAKQASQEQELIRRLRAFTENPALQNAMKQNTVLVGKSERLQKQAQSGELLNQFSLPQEKSVPLQPPAGGNRLSQLQQSDPVAYKRLQQEGGSFFGLKGLLEQINRTV